MVRNTIYSVALLLLLGLGVSAQTTDKAVEKIRSYYDDIAEKSRLASADEERGQFGGIFVNELNINSRNHQWRAVGIYSQNFKFYYRSLDTEEHLYPDQLVMVRTERRSSIRTYEEEFLFDDAGRLIFYFQKAANDDQVPTERRVYFQLARAVRIVEDAKTRDRFNAKDLKTAADIAAESSRIKDLFTRSMKL